jgi:hypothetical protein
MQTESVAAKVLIPSIPLQKGDFFMFPPFEGGLGGITTFAKYPLINMNQPCQF